MHHSTTAFYGLSGGPALLIELWDGSLFILKTSARPASARGLQAAKARPCVARAAGNAPLTPLPNFLRASRLRLRHSRVFAALVLADILPGFATREKKLRKLLLRFRDTLFSGSRSLCILVLAAKKSSK